MAGQGLLTNLVSLQKLPTLCTTITRTVYVIRGDVCTSYDAATLRMQKKHSKKPLALALQKQFARSVQRTALTTLLAVNPHPSHTPLTSPPPVAASAGARRG